MELPFYRPFFCIILWSIIAERISVRHWIADSGPGIGSCVVCMYVCHAFGMQLIFGKNHLSSGKDHSGFRNMCHVALENVTQKDWRTWRMYFCARAAARKLSLRMSNHLREDLASSPCLCLLWSSPAPGPFISLSDVPKSENYRL